MARDSAATRARILAAAIDEFSAHGLAGARIDRIADAAEANKRSIYVYFESKDGLFNAALRHVVVAVNAEVPLDTDDLPGYAGRLFDHYRANPATWRMSLWLPLERPDAGPDEGDAYAAKLAGMEGQAVTANAGMPVGDLVILVNAITRGFFMSPDSLLAAGGLDPHSEERAAVHRAAIVESVRRITGGLS